MPRASIQYSLLTNVLLCLAGVLVKYEEKARQKVAWVVLDSCPWVLPGLTCSYTPSYLPVGVLRRCTDLDDNGDDEHVWTWIRVVLISSGYYQKEQQGA